MMDNMEKIKIKTDETNVIEIMNRLTHYGYIWNAGQTLNDFTSVNSYSKLLLRGGGYYGAVLDICRDTKRVTHDNPSSSTNCDMKEFREIFKVEGDLDMERCEELERIEEVEYRCACCGNPLLAGDYRQGLDDELYCNSCFWEYHTTCDECDTLIWRDDCCYSERTDRYLCNGCYEAENSETINGYHCKDKSNLEYLGDGDCNALRFGMEIEVNNYRATWRELGMYAGGVRDILGDMLFDIQEDGSISNGFEIITNPMTKEYYDNIGVARLTEMCNYLKDNGFDTYGDDCGVHIHITRKPLMDANEDCYDVMNYLIETFKKDIQHYANRTTSSYAYYLSDSRCVINNNKPKMSEIKKATKETKGERYLVLNNNPSSTIELRCFASSIKIDDLNNYMAIANGLANAVIKNNWTYKTFKQLFGLTNISKNRTLSKKDIELDLMEIVQLKLKAVDIKNQIVDVINGRLDDYYEYIVNKLKEKRENAAGMDRTFMSDYNALCDMLMSIRNNYGIYANDLFQPTYDWLDNYKFRAKNKELLNKLVDEYNEVRVWL